VAQLKASSRPHFLTAVGAPGARWRVSTSSRAAIAARDARLFDTAADALDFARRLRRLAAANSSPISKLVADARRPLLTYAALGARYIIRVGRPKTIVFSTFGVREGLLYEMLAPQERAKEASSARANPERAAVALRGATPRTGRHGPIGWCES